jgi:hypothetical protein
LAVVASLSISGVLALTHEGGATMDGPPAVRVFDAARAVRPAVADETQDLRETGSFVFSHESLYVVSGTQVLRYARRNLSGPVSGTWSSSAPILQIADGEERGLVMVLQPDALTLVRFDDGKSPAPVWSVPIAAGSLAAPGSRMLLRSGSLVYVSDRSIPGVRVLALDPTSAPTTIATYASDEGRVNDMALWGRSLVLLTDSSLVVLDAGSGDAPKLRKLGTYATRGAATSVDINSRYAFVAEGSTVSVLDIAPASSGFLKGPVEGWDAQADIRAIRLDRNRRAYVLLPNSYEILDAEQFGGR